MPWQPPPPPPAQPPPLPPYGTPKPRSRWLPAAIIGSAVVIAAGLLGGSMILRDDRPAPAAEVGTSTCGAWAQTRDALRAVPPLPDGWTWSTPNIDTLIKFQNGPVGYALDRFEPQIKPEPAEVAQAASDYLVVRRAQMRSLADRSYQPADGAAVDAALARLNQLCEIPVNSRPA